MYRSRVKPWNSFGWQPSEKHIHTKAVSKEVIELEDKKVTEA